MVSRTISSIFECKKTCTKSKACDVNDTGHIINECTNTWIIPNMVNEYMANLNLADKSTVNLKTVNLNMASEHG